MRVIILALLAVVLSGCFAGGERLILSNQVGKVIKNLSNNYQVEAALCLKYQRTIGGNIYVKDYYFPRTYRSTRSSVSYARCPDGYNMMWHNHPVINMRSFSLWIYLKSEAGISIKDTRQLVYLSGVDLKSANSAGYGIVMVSTNDHIAWWHKSQFGKANGDRILLPINGQTASL